MLNSLTDVTQKLFTSSADKQMKINHDKCHLLLSTQNEENIQIVSVTIKRSLAKKILGITVDNKLRFDRYVENL